MNKQELRGAFSKLHAPDDLLGAVCALDKETKQRPNTWNTVRRVAAVVAVIAMLLTAALWPIDSGTEEPGIVAVPGVLKVYACELDEVDAIERVEYMWIEGDGMFPKSIWSPISGATEVLRGITFSFLIEEEILRNHNIELEVSTNCGELHGSVKNGYPSLEKTTVVSNSETVYWTGNEVISENAHTTETMEETIERLGGVYVDIVIRADGNIIGYAIFDIGCKMPNSWILCAALIESLYFPKVDGEFQNVSDEYVWKEIEKYKHTKLGQAEK